MAKDLYLDIASERAKSYRQNVDELCVYPSNGAEDLRKLFDVELLDEGRDGEEVLNLLADAAEAGLVGSTSGSFYGWVMGGSARIGVAADWLTASWGQNAAIYQTAPSAAVCEEIASKWIIDLLDLPQKSSFAFVTGATMASFICLAAARSEVLHRHGWNIEKFGQFNAPDISVYLSEEAHSSIYASLRYLGFGDARLVRINALHDGQMDIGHLADKLADNNGPAIIIGQAGHINTGAFDDFNAISLLAKASGAWVHIDGAFGLWAKASNEYSHLCDGAEKADSWAVDGHKWLQIPYDSGFAIIKDENAHQRAMATSAGYLNETPGDGRNPNSYGPELSRRARGFNVWAVLQHIGKAGVERIVTGNCKNASRLAARLNGVAGIRITHDVCLNQVAIVFENTGATVENLTDEVVSEIQRIRRHFVKSAIWRGETILRVSFSSGVKSDEDIDCFADEILSCWNKVKSSYQSCSMPTSHGF